MTGDHCSDLATCTFGVKRRGSRVCQWADCTDRTTDGVTYATDDRTCMHAGCWSAYDRAWNRAHRDAENDYAAAQEDRYFASYGA